MLPNASVSATKAAIISGMVNRGFTLRNEGASQLTFEKRGDTRTGGLIQAQFGFVANFTVIDQSPGVRVIAESAPKGYIGTSAEQPTIESPQSRQAAADVAAVLASLR